MLLKKLLTSCIFFIVVNAFGQVSLQTGASQFNLPLFSYQDQMGLSTSISLDYFNGNGLKVSEVASCVGTGWNLSYGGSITREQRGLPDDQKRSSSVPNPLPYAISQLYANDDYYKKYFTNGYLYSFYSASDIMRNEAGFVKMYPGPSMSGPNAADYRFGNGDFLGTILDAQSRVVVPESEFITADREQDIFHLTVGSKDIEFVIGKNGQVLLLNDGRVKIEFITEDMLSQNILTNISKFIVTDEDGTKYIFSDKELSQNFTFTNTVNPDVNGNIDLNQTPGYYSVKGLAVTYPKMRAAYTVSKWYLTRVFNPGIDQYVNPAIDNKSINFSYEQFDIDLPTNRQISQVRSAGNISTSLSIGRSHIRTLRIKQITCPQKATVNFYYSSLPRIDVPNHNALSAIEVVENGMVSKYYGFKYGYFFTSQIRPENYAFTENEKFATRLCLKSVQKSNNSTTVSEPPYEFDYYTGDASVSGLDIENIVPSMNTYWTDHWGYFNSKYPYSFEYRPTQIPYQYTLADYCFNAPTAKASVSGMAKNGIIKQIKYPLGATINFEYEQNKVFFNSANIDMGGVRVYRTVTYDGIDHNKDIITEYKYTKSDGISSSGWGYEQPLYSMVRANRIYQNSKGMIAVSFFQQASSTMISLIKDRITLGPSAFMKGLPQQAIVLAIFIVVDILIDFFGPTPPEYKDDVQTEYTNVAYQTSNSIPFMYSRVAVNKKSFLNVSNGKTIYEFRSPEETPLIVNSLTFPFSNKSRYAKWAYGMPKRIAVYDKTDKLISETYSDYNVVASEYINTNFQSKKWLANKVVMEAASIWSNTNYPYEFGNISESIYYPLKGHSELKQVKNWVYDKAGSLHSEAITSYTYNPITYNLTSIITTNSKNEQVEQKRYYPEDYSFGGFNTALINANKLTTPTVMETWITKGGQQKLISSSATEYAILNNGDIKPIKFYNLQAASPLLASELGPFNANQLIRNSIVIVPNSQVEYDGAGNVVKMNDLAGKRLNSSIYDYTQTYKIASVVNATVSDVGYTSFEGGGLEGGCTYSVSETAEFADAPTGKKAFKLRTGSSMFKSGLDPAKTYFVSYFIKGDCSGCTPNSSLTLNGVSSTNIVKSVLINGWTLIVQKVANPLNGTITILGNANIDELRIYPTNAMITSVTYAGGFGKSSECDENNRVTYYEYDDIGRLLYVKDESRNILKAFDYQYQQTPGNTLFYNTPQTGKYSRQCPAGNYGGIVTTTIAANTYSSTVSIEDANQLALNALAVSGQSAANTSGTACQPYSPSPLSISCNLTDIAMPLNNTFCNAGIPEFVTLFTNGSPIQPGVQLYTDAALTQKVLNKKWVKSFATNTNTVWALSSTGVVLPTGSFDCSSLPPSYISYSANVTSDASPSAVMCNYGTIYTMSVYAAFGTTIAPGAQLYTNPALTQKISNKTWIRFFNGSNPNTVWPLTFDGKISTNAPRTCPL